jgi:hypothetical protein
MVKIVIRVSKQNKRKALPYKAALSHPFKNPACYGKGKAFPLQAWTSPEDSRRRQLPDFKTIST